MSVRVLLVDDHQLVRLGLRTAISRDSTMQVIGEATDGAEGVEMARRLRPDVVLMDIQMPVLNGIEATRQITQELPDVKVLILTMYNEGNLPMEALGAGAVGYLHKDDDPAMLLQAIHKVAEGEGFLTPLLARQVLAKLHRNQQGTISQTTEAEILLTEREIELLRLVAAGLINKQIAQQLSLSEFSVRNQLSELYQKIQVKSRAQAAAYAVERRLI